MIFLASPDDLADAKSVAENLHPVVLEPLVLWNAERVFLRNRTDSASKRGTICVPAKITRKLPASWDDTRLVKECLLGNEVAWSSLIEKYKSLIYSIPVKYGLSQQDASDVFQATCLELLERLPDLRKPRALPKWLMQVAHHECYRWKRSQQRTISRDAEPELPEPEIPAIAESLVEQSEEEQAA